MRGKDFLPMLLKSVAVCGIVLSPLAKADANSYVYVSVAGKEQIAIYQMDEQSGALTHQEDVSVGGAPGAMDVGPLGQSLFVSLRSSGGLAGFRIDAASGKLSPINETKVAGSAAYVKVDHSGKFLLSAYYSAGKVMVHKIAQDGSLSAQALQTVETAQKAHAIVPDPTNRFVFVPHTGPNLIFQFAFNAETGQLAPNSVPQVVTAPENQPRHIAFHQNKKFAYVDNEHGSSVTAYAFDATSGTLSPFQRLSTLPTDFKENNSCADIEMHPSGKFVYSSNRGHDSIAGFAINPETGFMRAIGQAKTEKTPRSFNIDPTGRFLYAGGQGSGKLAAYRIDQQTGKLERFATYEVGPNPSWVQVVSTP